MNVWNKKLLLEFDSLMVERKPHYAHGLNYIMHYIICNSEKFCLNIYTTLHWDPNMTSGNFLEMLKGAIILKHLSNRDGAAFPSDYALLLFSNL